jgi:hypothetical protein
LKKSSGELIFARATIIYIYILEVIIFGSVFIKKNNQTEIFLKKPKPVSVRFFRTKTGLARFFPVLARFGSVFSDLARFFRFQAYKTEIKPN